MSASPCVVVGSVTEPGGCVHIPVIIPKPTDGTPHLVAHASSLAFTGADFGLLLAVGLVLVAVGLLLRWKRAAQ